MRAGTKNDWRIQQNTDIVMASSLVLTFLLFLLVLAGCAAEPLPLIDSSHPASVNGLESPRVVISNTLDIQDEPIPPSGPAHEEMHHHSEKMPEMEMPEGTSSHPDSHSKTNTEANMPPTQKRDIP